MISRVHHQRSLRLNRLPIFTKRREQFVENLYYRCTYTVMINFLQKLYASLNFLKFYELIVHANSSNESLNNLVDLLFHAWLRFWVILSFWLYCCSICVYRHGCVCNRFSSLSHPFSILSFCFVIKPSERKLFNFIFWSVVHSLGTWILYTGGVLKRVLVSSSSI